MPSCKKENNLKYNLFFVFVQIEVSQIRNLMKENST